MTAKNRSLNLSVYGSMRADELETMHRERTATHYRQAIRRYVEDMGDVRLNKLTSADICQWAEKLKATGISNNTVDFYLRQIKALYNHAVLMEIIKDDRPFYKIRIKPEETVKRALNEDQLNQLINLALTDKEAKARDMWLLSFMFRGMAPVDIAKLTVKNIEGDCICYRRSKTMKRIVVKIPAEARRILHLYKGDGCRLIDYDYKKTNYYLKKIGAKLGIPFPLTMYAARHTYATAMQREDAPLSVISQSLGHADTEVTRVYLAGIESTVVDKWNETMMSKYFNKH